MKNSLLLIEDSKEVYQMITQSLATSLLNIDWAQSIKEAEKLLSERNYQSFFWTLSFQMATA